MKESLKRSFASLGADGLVALWLGVWWCANLIEAGCTELANDEAYYHMFAQRLAWGYFDHPPVTALLVWLGERLFGGELGVRFFFTMRCAPASTVCPSNPAGGVSPLRAMKSAVAVPSAAPCHGVRVRRIVLCRPSAPTISNPAA